MHEVIASHAAAPEGLLATQFCWHAASQGGVAHWLMPLHAESARQLVTSDAHGPFIAHCVQSAQPFAPSQALAAPPVPPAAAAVANE
jgi:hypothetical protein